MKIKKVTVGIQLQSIPITYTFLAYVQENRNDTHVVFIPIGRQVIYAIGSNTFIAHTELPVLIHRQYHTVDVMEKLKFRKMLEQIIIRLQELDTQIYKLDGIQIQYVYRESLLDSDPRITTLVANTTPKQNVVRALIDVTDQMLGRNPTAHITITFYIADVETLHVVPAFKRKFYISQIVTKMEYQYDIKYLYFFNKEVGKFKYDMITGKIDFDLTKSFRTYLVDLFKRNYTTVSDNIIISTMALQADVNYGTILYN